MAVDDVYKVTVKSTAWNNIYMNVFNLRCKIAGDPTTANFNSFMGAWVTAWNQSQTTNVVYTDWTAVQQWGANMSIDAPRCRRLGGKQFAAAVVSMAGQAAGDSLPPQASAVVTWTTGIAGRRNRGRSYAYGLTETYQADGVWTVAATTGWLAALNTFLNLYKGGTGTDPTFTLGVWSERTASGCIPALPPNKGHIQVDAPHPETAFLPTTGFALRSVVFNQRRRTRGVGR